MAKPGRECSDLLVVQGYRDCIRKSWNNNANVVVVISCNPVDFRFHAQDETAAELVIDAELAAVAMAACSLRTNWEMVSVGITA
jgi:hypothetical protein